jgi:nucleotide-binding universal stress UspA family protein
MKINRIVVGIDFSSYSEVARKRALALAANTGAAVVLVHAFEDSDYQGQSSWMLKTKTYERLVQRSRRLAQEEVHSLAKPYLAAGIQVQAEVSDLGPDKALIAAVERHDAELLVVGTHGYTGIKRMTMARIAQRVVRNSPCSVLVARATATDVPSMARILVPTDFSESANNALTLACSLVADDGQIDVLHCWRAYFYPTGYHGLYEETVALEPEMAESIRSQGAELIRDHENPRSKLHFSEQFVSPVDGIAEMLEAHAYDMVIMGSHGRHGVKRLLLGSTAEATVRQANCSVLIVRQRP